MSLRMRGRFRLSRAVGRYMRPCQPLMDLDSTTHLESQTACPNRCVTEERENDVECEAQETECKPRDR